ncbi:MAG: cell division protein FtsQ [Polaromonas sp.]|nr:cell division protein FtsQ [Polaromonas sp.]
MNALSVLLCLVFLAMLLTLLVSWLMRQSLFSLNGIVVHGDVAHNNTVTLRANVAPRLAGNFFTVDLAQTQKTFESVPWVRQAVVQRQFPNQLKVRLQEHQAIAYWGPDGHIRLINNFGEIFEANPGDVESEGLPQLNGPDGQAARVLGVYQTLAPLFEQREDKLQGLELTMQGSWRAYLDTGAVIELGHGSAGEIEARVQRFVSTLTQVAARFGRDVESADLRYGNGYALRLKGVTTVIPGDKEDKKAKR